MIWMSLRQHGKIIDAQIGSFTHVVASFYTPSSSLFIHSPPTQTIASICARIKPRYMACGHLSLSWKSLYWPLQIPMNMDWWPYPNMTNWWYNPFMFQTTSQMNISSSWSGTSFGDSWIPPREILGPSEPIIEKPVPSSCTWSNIEKRSWKQILVILAIMTHMLLEEPTNCRMFSSHFFIKQILDNMN